MKHPKVITGLLALVLSAAVAHAAPKLSIGDKGVVIDGGELGKATFVAPTFRTAKGEEKPVYAKKSDTEGVAEYASGLKVTFTARGDRITAHFENAPKDAKNLRFSFGIPMSWSQGGKYAFDDAEMKLLPADKGDQHVQHGSARTFSVSNPSGTGYKISTPGGYQGLMDLRVWGQSSFSYHYQFDMTGKTEGDVNFQIKPLTAAAGGTETPEVKPAVKKLVDKYGQNITKDFPGKVKSDEELKADGVKQLEEMAAFQPDPKLDTYGGLAGSGAQYNLKKTGFFHVEKINDRWVMVSPEGNLFFQLGMCGIAATDDHTLVKGREDIYEWLPPKDGNLAGAWRPNTPGVMSFYIANLIRKFDKPYDFNEWTKQVMFRLKSWGFNSAGAFSANTEAMKAAKFPRVSFLPLGKGGGVEMLPDKIGAAEVFDPFTPGVEEALDAKFAKGVAENKDDPTLIGYFLGNEQHFETLPKLIPTYKASKVASKAKLVETLKAKYQTIDAFNTAWNPATPFKSFDDLGEATLFVRTDAGAADMLDFYRSWLEAYYSTVERVFRKHDPNHLLIGSRWTPGTSNNKDCVTIGGKYLDVISINLYGYAIDKTFLDRVYEWAGKKPMIFSEWHYGSTDHGLQAHVELADDNERASAYRNYVEQSAATGYVVGHQWFIYTDQAITGRFFSGFHGEANNTGFVDVTDRPYTALVNAAKETNARIYDVALGKTPPFQFEHPKFDPKRDGNANLVVQIVRALQPIKLDGTTSTFPGVPGTPIAADRIATGKVNPNLSGDFRVVWDDNNFYFHIQVKDPTPLASEKSGNSMWAGDCVELFIGPKDIDKGGSLTFTDRQILVGIKPEPEVHFVDHPEDGKQCQVVLVKDVSNDGYVLQLAIPWKLLGVDPKNGTELLFDVCIDNSDPGTGRLQQLGWNGLGKQSKDRGAWGKAKIVSN